MTAKKLDKLSWSRSGRPVAPSERKTLLGVIRRARREGRVRDHASQDEKIDRNGKARIAPA